MRGFEAGIKNMYAKEKSVFTVRPDYAFAETGIVDCDSSLGRTCLCIPGRTCMCVHVKWETIANGWQSSDTLENVHVNPCDRGTGYSDWKIGPNENVYFEVELVDYQKVTFCFFLCFSSLWQFAHLYVLLCVCTYASTLPRRVKKRGR